MVKNKFNINDQVYVLLGTVRTGTVKIINGHQSPIRYTVDLGSFQDHFTEKNMFRTKEDLIKTL